MEFMELLYLMLGCCQSTKHIRDKTRYLSLDGQGHILVEEHNNNLQLKTWNQFTEINIPIYSQLHQPRQI